MRNGSAILLGGGRYIQNAGALSVTGSEAAAFGKKAFVLAGKTAWAAAREKIEQSLKQAKVDFSLFIFDGYCSEPYTRAIAAAAGDYGADVLIGVGGGKVMDAAKWSADKAGVPCVTVPTSAATCAAYVSNCVIYDDTGSMLVPGFTRNLAAAVIVDSELIARAPPRLFASGIADALAKFPEINSGPFREQSYKRRPLPRAGLAMCGIIMDAFFKNGLEALENVRQKKVTPVMEDILCTSLMITGLINPLISGEKHYAFAHTIYDVTTIRFKEQRKNFLHGEIVGCGLPVQMGINGDDETDIAKVEKFLKALSIPVKLGDMGIEPTAENLKVIADLTFTRMGITDADTQKRFKENLLRIA